MIRIKNLCAGYGPNSVLHSLDMKVEKGECIGLIGPNGSGKTTLLKALSGLIPFMGSVQVHGQDIEQTPSKKRARHMAMVPQRFTDGFELRTESIVMMGRYPHQGFWGTCTPQDHEIVENVMMETDTMQFHGRKVGHLSGGELQRVLLARALAQNTPILLLDEATAGLDHVRSIEIFDIIKRRHALGTTVLTVMHDLNLAALYCEKIAMLKNGKIIVYGETEDVFTSENLGLLYDSHIHVGRHPIANAPQAFYIPTPR